MNSQVVTTPVRVLVWIVIIVFLLALANDVLIAQHARPAALFMWGVPAIAGMIGIRRSGRFANFCLMIGSFQLTLVAAHLVATRKLDPVLLIPGTGILPGIGRYSGVSPGGLLFPLVFALLALIGPLRGSLHR